MARVSLCYFIFWDKGVNDGTKDDRILARGEGRDKNDDFEN